jgi:hypothetical protein
MLAPTPRASKRRRPSSGPPDGSQSELLNAAIQVEAGVGARSIGSLADTLKDAGPTWVGDAIPSLRR